MIWTRAFWAGAGERAIKTFFQTCLAAVLITKATFITGLDWYLVLNMGALAAVISLMTSVGNADFTAGKGSSYKRSRIGRHGEADREEAQRTQAHVVRPTRQAEVPDPRHQPRT